MILFGLICFLSSVASCPPLFPQEGVEVRCSYYGQVLDCATSESPAGTLANYNCRRYFETASGSLVCTDKNVWDSNGQRKYCIFRCQPKCGMRGADINKEFEERSKTTELIVLGTNTTSSAWPWHAGIFHYQPELKKYEYSCGGSFTIEPNTGTQMIITAAHCLFNDKEPTQPQNLKVIIGSLSSDFGKNSDPAQIFDVKYFKIHEKYDTSIHTNDIAYLILNDSVKIGMSALPVCFPSPYYANMIIGNTGVVAGYGKTESKKLSEILKYTQLHVVEHEKCSYTRTEPGFQFCAGPIPQKKELTQKQDLITSPCNGDSGGGFVVKQGRYFIAGIVSITKKYEEDTPSEVCQSNTIFTQVDGYLNWMRDSLFEPTATATVPTTKSSFVAIKFAPIKDTDDYLNVGLVLHNNYREMHGSQPLILNSTLTNNAQQWAEYLANEHLWDVFPNTDEYLTNQFQLSSDGPPVNFVEAVEQATETWYNSSRFYDWSEPEKNRTTFSQLIWNSTTQLGIGVASKGKDTIVIAAYSPPGNYVGANGKYYRDNVFPIQQIITNEYSPKKPQSFYKKHQRNPTGIRNTNICKI